MTAEIVGKKIIATHAAARFNYVIEDSFEAGLVLTGTEVKSLRSQAPSLKDAFVEVQGKLDHAEAWLKSLNIPPYSFGNRWNHEPLRPRKLLLHREELKKLFLAAHQKGFVFIPLKLYFKRGRVKLELGVGKGKKLFDKRDQLKKKAILQDWAREARVDKKQRGNF